MGDADIELPAIRISERVYPNPAQKQVRKGLPARRRRPGGVLRQEEAVIAAFSRLSLLWKILLSTSVAITALFAITGWIVQRHAVNTTSVSLDEEVKASFQAYESLWRSRATCSRR